MEAGLSEFRFQATTECPEFADEAVSTLLSFSTAYVLRDGFFRKGRHVNKIKKHPTCHKRPETVSNNHKTPHLRPCWQIPSSIITLIFAEMDFVVIKSVLF